MKKNLILVVLIVAVPLLAAAQEIAASPLEGRWVWNEKGLSDPGYKELIFFGNVLLGGDGNPLRYRGNVFSHTRQTVNFNDQVWQYRLSGNTLTITDESNTRFTYVKTNKARSPLEGIWKEMQGSGYYQNKEMFFLFVGDILAIKEDIDYQGMNIVFSGRWFHPTLEWLRSEHGGGIGLPEGAVDETSIEYTVSGRILTLNIEDEEVTLRKVY